MEFAERKLAQIGIEEVLKQLVELMLGELAGGRWIGDGVAGQCVIWFGVCLHGDSVADSRGEARGMCAMSMSLRSGVVDGGEKGEGDAPRRTRRAWRRGVAAAVRADDGGSVHHQELGVGRCGVVLGGKGARGGIEGGRKSGEGLETARSEYSAHICSSSRLRRGWLG